MYKKHVLENGLTIIGEEIPYVKSISLGVWINAGSRIEDEEISGVSHFIEHMLFKGTRNRTSKQIASEIDNLGGQINAFTSKECTCYYVKLLDSHIDIGIDVLSDMLLNSKFSESDIDKERSVIIEELKMYEDSPEDLAYDLLTEHIYKEDPLGMNIIGTEESLKRLNKDKTHAFMIGDTQFDILAAKAAGISHIALSCGYESIESLQKYSDCIKNNAYEAVKYIAKL